MPWWAFAIAFVLAVASVAMSINERAQYAVRLAQWRRYADSARAVTKAARASAASADSDRAKATARADSQAMIADMSRHAADVARAQARAALAALHGDSGLSADTSAIGVLRRAQIKVLQDLLLMDSAALDNAYFSHLADSTALAKSRKSIFARDAVINGLQQELRLAQDKPQPRSVAVRFSPFAEGGVGATAGNGNAGAGVVVAGGMGVRLFGPLSVVGRLQYDGAAKAGSAQALVHFTF